MATATAETRPDFGGVHAEISFLAMRRSNCTNLPRPGDSSVRQPLRRRTAFSALSAARRRSVVSVPPLLSLPGPARRVAMIYSASGQSSFDERCGFSPPRAFRTFQRRT
jgi:hypothetical protein